MNFHKVFNLMHEKINFSKYLNNNKDFSICLGKINYFFVQKKRANLLCVGRHVNWFAASLTHFYVVYTFHSLIEILMIMGEEVLIKVPTAIKENGRYSMNDFE